jgi:hypothetical protein
MSSVAKATVRVRTTVFGVIAAGQTYSVPVSLVPVMTLRARQARSR